MTKNNSGIVPLQYKVIIKVDPTETVTKGGVIIPEHAQDRRAFEVTRGDVVAVGPAAFTDGEQFPEGSPKPQVGDRIWFDKHAGSQVKGREGDIVYRIVEDTDVVGIYELSADEAQELGLVA